MAHAPSKIRNLNRDNSKGLNLIPIMNLFIVIIPMLMTIMVSVHLAMVEIVLPKKGMATNAMNEEQEKPKTLRLNILTDAFEILIVEDERTINIPVLDNSTNPAEFNFLRLNDELMKLKEEFPDQPTMEILPDPDVKYDTLLRSIDVCKINDFPNIRYKLMTTKYYKASGAGEEV